MNKGFSLIEIVIVLFIIGVMATIGIPRFLRNPVSPVETFIGQLNLLLTDAVGYAQEKRTIQRIVFNFVTHKVEWISQDKHAVIRTTPIPPLVDFSDIVIEGKSQFAQGAEGKQTVYFLIGPQGLVQEVSLTLTDKAQVARGGRGMYEFNLNPFTAIFRLK